MTLTKIEEGKMKEVEKTGECKHRKYSGEWNAYYCEKHSVWLKEKCNCKEKEEENEKL